MWVVRPTGHVDTCVHVYIKQCVRAPDLGAQRSRMIALVFLVLSVCTTAGKKAYVV